MRPDFNTEDAFKILNSRGEGSVASYDIKQSLGLIGVYATHDEINLLMKRSDLDKDQKLSYAEFCRMITPVDLPYALLLENRKSNGVKRSYYRDECFQFSTRLHYKEFWRTLFSVERNSDNLRARLARDPNFDTLEAFKYCDINKDGIVTEKELSKVLRYKNFLASEQELKVLMKKLDKDHDG